MAKNPHPGSFLSRPPAVAIALALVVLAGCDRPGEGGMPGLGTVENGRFIARDPDALLDRENLFRRSEHRVWDLTDSEEAGRWQAVPAAGPADIGSVPGRGRWTLERAVDLDASRIAVFEVDVTGFASGSVRVGWRGVAEGDGAGPPTRGQLAARSGAPLGQGERRFRFAAGDRPEWRGRITRLTVELRSPAAVPPTIRRVAALRRELKDSAVAEARRRTWKVDLGHEVRSARLAPLGEELRYLADVPRGSRLRLAWGMDASVREALTFTVRVEREDGSGDELLASSHGPDEADRWHEARLPLDAYAGRDRRFVFSVRDGDGGGGFSSLAFWAGVEIVRPMPDPPPNVLLISVDTLRADRLSSYGYPRRTSPRLDEWAARRATLFRRVVASAPWTLPSHVSMLSGFDALRHGINHGVLGGQGEARASAMASLDLLPEILWRRGYSTAAFTGGAFLHPKYGFAQGFDRYAYWPDRARDRLELKLGVDRTLEWMADRRDEPFFCLLHTYAVHDPYEVWPGHFERLAPGLPVPQGEVALRYPKNDPARGFQQRNHFVFRPQPPGGGPRRLGPADREMIDALYDSGVAYADEEIGRLLDGVERLGLADRTLVILTSDHGEALGERGRAGHVDLHDPTLLVPLIIALPEGRGAGRVVEPQVRSIDILPTVLEALGREPPPEIDGVSLLPLIDGRPGSVPLEAWSYSAAANYGLSLSYGGRLKYVFNNTAWGPVGGREELYDLLADPAERDDLALAGSGASPEVELLRDRLRTYWERNAAGLELRIANASGGILRGEFEGPMVRPVGTKSLDPGPRCLAWREMGSATFDLPPESSCTVLFEKVFGRALHLRGELVLDGERFAFERRLEIEPPPKTVGLEFAGRSWRSVREGAPETGLALGWRGPETLATPAPSDQDEQLREQLEALGYLD